MNQNENLEAVQATENTEHTAEQTPKTYTQEEVDAIVGKRIARTKAKILKDVDRKYGRLEEVLKAGTGKENVEEVTDTFEQFYQKKGIVIPTKPSYTDQDIEVLARADADEIIRSGYDEVVEEVERLTNIGAEGMTAREKAAFKVLAEHRMRAERAKELSEIGVTEDVYDSQDFKDFASQFNANTPIQKVYDLYQKTQPKKNIKPMGSMKNSTSDDSTIKDFYTPEEARRFTKKDYDENPALYAAVEASMLKWKR